jgi:hypothetical protein
VNSFQFTRSARFSLAHRKDTEKTRVTTDEHSAAWPQPK